MRFKLTTPFIDQNSRCNKDCSGNEPQWDLLLMIVPDDPDTVNDAEHQDRISQYARKEGDHLKYKLADYA
ncbi:MAG TPA: hypothetical protein DCP49_09100 [Erysipelotrichaceae bacterium]|nr:hypothetical protein [Erysipelotrichaceae bacterium]